MSHPEKTNPEKFKRQLALEEEMLGMGVARFREEMQKAVENGMEATTHGGLKIMKEAFIPLEKALVDWKKHCEAGKVGRPIAAYKLIKDIPSDILAFLTAKTVIDTLSRVNTIQEVTARIAGAIQIEDNMKTFKKKSPNHYKKVRADVLKRSKNTTHIVNVLKSSARKDEIDLRSFTPIERHQIGSFLLSMFIENTGLVEIYKPPQRGKNTALSSIIPTQATTDWLNTYNSRCELLSPVLMPMIVEPKDWKQPIGGGFWNASIKVPLVRTPNYKQMDELYNLDMWEIYQAINHAQKTKWKVNKDVLDVMQQVINNNTGLGNLPSGAEIPLPPTPDDIATNKEAKWIWKKKASKVYQENQRQRSKFISLNKQIFIADKYKDEEEFYFVYTSDFRGRLYPAQTGLQPQGDDCSKGLLTFAEGKPLDDETGAWLAVHGANVFGYDKVSLHDRVSWVQENQEVILQSADDPYSNQWWTKADKPWQFLAFCYEWKGFMEDPENFLSCLPVAMDGSCNGLQNFSAMLRDPIGGKATNLLPSETPQDIYTEVSKVVERKLQEDIKKGTKEAKCWEGFVCRKLVKRPTMTMPYGATLTGYTDQLIDELKSWEDAGKPAPTSLDNGYEEFRYMAQLISDSLGEVVVAARVAMDWLQDVAKIIAKENLPIYWTTPVGFPVMQNYRNLLTRRIQTEIAGSFHKLSVAYQEGHKIDVRRMSSGIAPNFVHSCDSAHLIRTISLCDTNNIVDIAMVHDSFGTHAANIPSFNQIIRHAFIQIHEAEPLDMFYKEMCRQCSKPELIPPPPPKGDLDISLVLEADFFFA